MASKDSQESPKFRDLPKASNGLVDVERIKAQYIEAESISFVDFCKELNYDRRALLDHFPQKKWRDEKIALIVKDSGEENENRAIKAHARLVKEQLEVMEKAPSALFGALRLFQYVVRGYENAASQDLKDKLAKKHLVKGYKSSFDMTPSDLASIAVAGKTITEALFKALHLANDAPSAALVLVNKVPTMTNMADEETDIQREITVKGLGRVDPRHLSQHLLQFFDQAPAQPTPPAPKTPVTADVTGTVERPPSEESEEDIVDAAFREMELGPGESP